jgi:Holliday junction DNA helicase RuvA
MIAQLKGLVEAILSDAVILDVHGVGYKVFCSQKTLSNLPALGEAVVLLIETHVREDHIHLYGFSSEEEQAWFLKLSSVQGVGNRTALSILSVLSPLELQQAIAAQDKTSITRADGVGAKIALRIVTELKDKVVAMPAGVAALRRGNAPMASQPQGVFEDAVSALVHLGYQRSAAVNAVGVSLEKVSNTNNLQEIIKVSLQELSA